MTTWFYPNVYKENSHTSCSQVVLILCAPWSNLIICIIVYWLFFQDNICDVIKNIEYHDIDEDEEVILEHFRLLVNLSATNVAHDEIITGTQEYFRILTQAVSRQIQVLYLKINFLVISLFFVLYNVTLSFLFCNCSITYMYYIITTDK